MKYFVENIIDSTSLTLDDWLKFLLSKERNQIFPNNCFPTYEIQNEYLNQISSKSDIEVKAILRRFLVHSGNFGKDKFYADAVLKGKAKNEIKELVNSSEYIRRLVTNKDTWEGITWILDLLPTFPNEALKGLDSYFLAHCQILPDYSLNGLSDAGILITAKYIDFEHPQEIFLSLTPDEFELLSEELYKKKGYKTELTKKSHDGGIDIIAEKVNGSNKEKLLIQCKRYTKKITVREVRELNGTFQDYPIKTGEKATKAVLITSSDFTRSVKKEFLNNHSIELINHKDFGKMLNEYEGRYWPSKLHKIFWDKRKQNLQ